MLLRIKPTSIGFVKVQRKKKKNIAVDANIPKPVKYTGNSKYGNANKGAPNKPLGGYPVEKIRVKDTIAKKPSRDLRGAGRKTDGSSKMSRAGPVDGNTRKGFGKPFNSSSINNNDNYSNKSNTGKPRSELPEVVGARKPSELALKRCPNT